MTKTKAPQVFHRPLFNAGRWCLRTCRFPSDAVIETAGRRAREVLPEGFVVASPPNIKEVDSIRAFGDSLVYNGHGGGCCGRTHLSGFGMEGPTERLIASVKNQTQGRRCNEITLTQSQATRRGLNGWTWAQVLTHLGWKMVMKFRNGNSGNNVLVYLYSSSER